jgi:uncharacterized repeat protein (TIGR01451 family)
MKLKKLIALWAIPMLVAAGQLRGAPVISSFSPKFGASGDPGFITINGSGFSPGTLVVKFNGVTDPTATATTASQIQARVPAGAPLGAGPISVSVAGQETLSSEDFTVIGPGPYISGFTPSIGNSGTPVTITGAHFSNPVTVKFTGANPFNTNAAATTQFTVLVPAGAMSGPITVSNALGTYTTATNFHVPPALTGFAPSQGRAGTNVIITGSSLLDATIVRFGGLDAAGFTVLSNGAIQATVPANATNGLLRVSTPAGTAFSSSNFVVPPTLTGFAPAFGPVGTSVTVSGANFTDGTPVVRFNGVSAAPPTGVTFGQLTAVVPAGATTGPITVSNVNGTATSATLFYLPARITAIAPSNSAPGTTVRITGENFTDASAVNFTGAAAASFVVSNNTTLGAVVPFGAQSGPVSVTTPAGTTNSAVRFYAPPAISVFNPTHGLPGTNVTVTGQNFLDATFVRFNGSNAVFTVLNNTTLTATVPANAQTGPLTVVAPAGTNTSAQNFVLDYTANVSVSVTDAPDPVTVTSNLTYTIVVANSGPFPAAGVTLTNMLPAAVSLKSATTTAGSLHTNGNPVTADLGQINPGGSATVTLVVVPQAEGTIVNVASAASLYTDPAPSNNAATNTTFVQPLPLLSIRLAAPDTVRVSWPASLTNFTLQSVPQLAVTNDWSNVLAAPQTAGNESYIIESGLGPGKLYRLKK